MSASMILAKSNGGTVTSRRFRALICGGPPPVMGRCMAAGIDSVSTHFAGNQPIQEASRSSERHTLLTELLIDPRRDQWSDGSPHRQGSNTAAN